MKLNLQGVEALEEEEKIGGISMLGNPYEKAVNLYEMTQELFEHKIYKRVEIKPETTHAMQVYNKLFWAGGFAFLHLEFVGDSPEVALTRRLHTINEEHIEANRAQGTTSLINFLAKNKKNLDLFDMMLAEDSLCLLGLGWRDDGKSCIDIALQTSNFELVELLYRERPENLITFPMGESNAQRLIMSVYERVKAGDAEASKRFISILDSLHKFCKDMDNKKVLENVGGIGGSYKDMMNAFQDDYVQRTILNMEEAQKIAPINYMFYARTKGFVLDECVKFLSLEEI